MSGQSEQLQQVMGFFKLGGASAGGLRQAKAAARAKPSGRAAPAASSESEFVRF